MKIDVLANSSGYGGAEKSIELLVKNIVKEFGYEVQVWGENEKLCTVFDDILQGKNSVKRFRGGNGFFTVLYNSLKYTYHKINYKPDLILSNTEKGALILAISEMVWPTKIKKALFLRDFQWRYLKFILKNIDSPLVIFPSKALMDYEPYYKLLKESNYKILPNIVNNIFSDREKITYKIAPTYQIVQPGKFSKWKGLEYSVKALAKIIQKKSNIHLLIIGDYADEAYKQHILKLIDKLDLGDVILFKSYVDDLGKYYSSSDLTLNTSISEFGGPETFGRTIIESWAHGTPAVSFNVGGPKYLIENEKNGFLVEEKNINELAQVILNYFDKYDEYQELRENAFRSVHKYQGKEIANKFINLINDKGID